MVNGSAMVSMKFAREIFAAGDRVRVRSIEWSLRAFASIRAVRLFLRARAVISFVMRAASTLKITNKEQRAL